MLHSMSISQQKSIHKMHNCFSMKRLFCITVVFAVVAMTSCIQFGSRYFGSGYSDLQRAKKYYRQANYKRSLEICNDLTTRYTRIKYFDQALYYTALNYLQIGLPEKNFENSIEYFKRIIDECPGSRLLPESAGWVTLLTELDSFNCELESKQKTLAEKEAQLSSLNTQLSTKKSQLKDNNKQIRYLQNEVDKLQKKIDLLEKVDLQTHQRKRDLQDATGPGDDQRKDTGS